MNPIHSFTFTRLTPPGQLSLPSALQRFVDSYEDLLLTPATASHQENTIPAETRQDLADFFDDTDLLTKSDAALIQLCISAFRSGAYPRDRKLTLNNINIILENSEEVEFPENITLVNCTLGSPGQVRFYRGTMRATVGHAGVTALGPKATAVAEEWLSSATAIDGATAIAQGRRSLAWAVGNGSIARAIGERSTGCAACGAVAYGKGQLSETFAIGEGSKAYAAGDSAKTEASKGAICYVLDQGKVGVAKGPGSEVWGVSEGCTLIAEDGGKAVGVGPCATITARKHSQGIVRGLHSMVLSEKDSTAIAEGEKTSAYALDSSSTALATVPDARSYFSHRGEGTVFQALGEITLRGTKNRRA